MVDYVDIRETYLVAGDFDSRRRYVMSRSGADNPLAICSGVTWTLGVGAVVSAHPFQDWSWRIQGRGDATFQRSNVAVPTPAPQVVTSCRI